jgi:hypothetical protein
VTKSSTRQSEARGWKRGQPTFRIVGRVGRATARDALCRGFDPCRQRLRGVAVDFGPKQSGWLINQLGNPSFEQSLLQPRAEWFFWTGRGVGEDRYGTTTRLGRFMGPTQDESVTATLSRLQIKIRCVTGRITRMQSKSLRKSGMRLC